MLAARSELQPGREDQVDDMVRGQIWLVFSVHHTQWLGYLHMDYLSGQRNKHRRRSAANPDGRALPYGILYCCSGIIDKTGFLPAGDEQCRLFLGGFTLWQLPTSDGPGPRSICFSEVCALVLLDSFFTGTKPDHLRKVTRTARSSGGLYIRRATAPR